MEVFEAVELALIVCEVVAEAGAAARDENRICFLSLSYNLRSLEFKGQNKLRSYSNGSGDIAASSTSIFEALEVPSDPFPKLLAQATLKLHERHDGSFHDKASKLLPPARP